MSDGKEVFRGLGEGEILKALGLDLNTPISNMGGGSGEEVIIYHRLSPYAHRAGHGKL